MTHRLAASDFSAMLRFVHQIQAARDLDQFSTEVVRGLRGLIASDLVAYNHVDNSARRIMWLSDPDDGGKFPGSDAILSAHMGENPLIAHLIQGRDDRWRPPCVRKRERAT